MTNWYYVPEFSGAAMQCHRLSLELVKLGLNVQVLTGTGNPAMVGEDIVDGIKVTRVLRDTSTPLRHLRYGWNIFRFIIKNHKNFDLIHSHGFIAPVNLAALLTRVPLVQKITNLHVDDPVTVKHRKWGCFLLMLYRRARVIIPTSEKLESTCEGKHIKNQPFTRLPNGINPRQFKPVAVQSRLEFRRKLGIPDDHLVLLSVGSVNYNKGMDLLIKAIAELKKTVKRKFVVLIVGPNKLSRNYALGNNQVDPFSQSLLKIIADKSLFKTIRFEGVRANVVEYMQAADIYIHPSRQEGQPNAIIEAMACGLPVVANLLHGITDELLQNGKCGYVVNGEDEKEFASAIRVLVNNDSLRLRLATFARVETLQNYNLWKIAEKYRSLYSHVINNEPVKSMEHELPGESLFSILNNIKIK